MNETKKQEQIAQSLAAARMAARCAEFATLSAKQALAAATAAAKGQGAEEFERAIARADEIEQEAVAGWLG